MERPRPNHHPGFTRNYSGLWPRTPGRLLGTGFVRIYQFTLSGFVGNHCRHLPTCSEYAYEAIARHGLWSGGWLALFRVMRCGPGGTHGIDNVPQAFAPDRHWWVPWRLWRAGDMSWSGAERFDREEQARRAGRR